MKYARRDRLIIALLVLVLIFVFGYAYNTSIRKGVFNTIQSDREELTAFNNEIIAAFQEAPGMDDWQSIVDSYDELHIAVKDSDNQVILKSAGREWSLFDVKVRTPFDYQGHAYMIVSCMRLMGNRDAQQQYLFRILFFELLIGLSALCVLIFAIYSILLRPYHRFYMLLEAYEHGDTPTEQKFRGTIGKIYARFLQMTRTLDRQQENQQRIIASISHDIKTPLTSILGYTERLRKSELSPERQEKYLCTIYEKATEMQALIDEFDEYLGYKMEQAPRAEVFSTVALCDLLRSEFEDELHYEGIAFTLNNRAPQARVALDRRKVKRVAGNIISNSAKHVPHPGGVIEITIEADRTHVFIFAADNGDGVREDQLPLIFEPLYTTDNSRKVAGLGLAICKEIVEKRGGTIEAGISAALGGLEIRITLPREK